MNSDPRSDSLDVDSLRCIFKIRLNNFREKVLPFGTSVLEGFYSSELSFRQNLTQGAREVIDVVLWSSNHAIETCNPLEIMNITTHSKSNDT